MKSDQKNKKQIRCFKYNKVGHIAKLCKDGDNVKKKRCNICKKTNHEKKVVILEIRGKLRMKIMRK